MRNTDRNRIEKFSQLYQEQKSRFCQSGIASIQVSASNAPESLILGRPAITVAEIRVNEDAIVQFAQELARGLCNHISDNFHNLIDIIGEGPALGETLAELVRRTCRGDGTYLSQLSRRYKVAIDHLSFFAVFLTRPVRQAVDSAVNADYSQWRFGYCPVCGLWPRMARINTEDNRRWLWCIGCESEWKFPRLRCPFCLENDQEKLGYLRIDESDGYRIYTCETCRRYLKTHMSLEGNEASNLSLDAEYLLTTSLDVTATFEKYIQDFVGFAAFDLLNNGAAQLYREKAMT